MDDKEKQPNVLRWEPGMELSSEGEYHTATEWLAKELLRENTPEQLAIIAAQHVIYLDCQRSTLDSAKSAASAATEAAETKDMQLQRAALVNEVLVNDTVRIIGLALKENGTYKARKSVEVRHDKPGGSRDLKRQIQAVWATGKYSSRALCAEQEWDDLGFGSYDVARKALRNTPKPT